MFIRVKSATRKQERPVYSKKLCKFLSVKCMVHYTGRYYEYNTQYKIMT